MADPLFSVFLILDLNCEVVGVKSVLICFELLLLSRVFSLSLLPLSPAGLVGAFVPCKYPPLSQPDVTQPDAIALSFGISRKLPTFSVSSSSSSFSSSFFQAQGFIQEK